VNWSTITQDGLGVLHVRNDVVYATSVRGVKRIDLEAKRVVDVGMWNMDTPAPVSLDLDSYQGRLFAVTRTATSYQAYRLDGDTAWKEVAYPLPGTVATVTSSILAVDAGWMVLSHQLTEGFVDSAGVYAFDLNDFTSVNEEGVQTSSSINVYDNGDDLVLQRCVVEPARIIVTDLHGRSLYDGRLDATRTTETIRVANAIRGLVGITIINDAGTVLRATIVR
jgi:hypothetical protein